MEKPGWAIAVTGFAGVAAVVSFFLNWFRVDSFLSTGYLEQQGIDTTRVVAGVDKEWVTPFSVVDTVEEMSGQGLDPFTPGSLAGIVFPWLALALTFLCIVVAAAASFGLRRRTRTTVARILAVVLLLLAVAVVGVGCLDLGWREGGMTYADGNRGAAEWTSWGVNPDVGAAVWSVALLLMGIAAVMGPRIVHRLPPGAHFAPGTLSPQFAPGVHPPCGAAPMANAPEPAVRVTTNVSAIVGGAFGAVLCLVGYGFLPWGEDTTFSDIGKAAREYGFKDQPLIEAYFAWLGWAILALSVVVLVLLTLGRSTTALKPSMMRPILGIASLVAAACHAWMWIVLADDGAQFEIGAYAVALGLLLTVIAALAPLRRSVRVTA